MIVLPQDGRLRLVTQPDHARLAAEVLALWRSDGMPEHPRRRELLFAVREHDNGWREADAAPSVDPHGGRPYDFLSLPAPRRIELWSRGVDRFAPDRPYAALLIVEHARRIHRDRASDPLWAPFFEHLDELRSELESRAGAARRQVEADYRWLALADELSLAACGGRPTPMERDGRRVELREDRLRIDPFPLAGATTFELACRFVADRRYAGDADLGGELAAAVWRRQRLTVCPG